MRNHVFLGVILLVLLVFLCACDRETVGSDSVTLPCANSTSETEPASETDPPVSVSPASDFLYEEDGDGITILEYKGEDKNVVIPAMIEGKPVTAIGKDKTVFFDTISVVMPNTVKEIRDRAFFRCSDLTTVVFSNTLEKIGAEAFRECDSLSDFTFPNSLTQLGGASFLGCSALRSLSLPGNLTKVEDFTFYDSGLETIFLPDGIQTIYSSAFTNTPLKTIVFPDSVKEIQMFAFDSCLQLETVIFGKGLEAIGDGAFSQNVKLTEITIPASVTTIADSAFEECTGLKRLVFEGDAPVIKESLPDATVRDNLDYTVCYRSTAKGFSYPEWQGFRTEIADLDADSPLITNAIRTEGDYDYFFHDDGAVIFRYRGNASDVDIPAVLGEKAVIEIGNCAFAGNQTIVSVKFPDTVVSIGNRAFEKCKNLTSIQFPSKLERIGSKAFSCCVVLPDHKLPDTLSEIGAMAFAVCWELRSFCIPASVRTLESYTFYNSGVQTVYGESNSRLETISQYAFAQSNLRKITLPASVRNVTRESFYCHQLQYLYFEGDAPEDFGENVGRDLFIICFHQGAKSFTTPQWQGYRTEIW